MPGCWPGSWRSSGVGRGDHIELPDLTGRTILVTGASSGIGRAAALRLAAAGATVLAHGRSAHRLGELARHLGTEPLRADFARLQDVRGLARQVIQRTGRLDAILHNAGTYHKSRVLTEDGHESTFQTNYLAPFLLQSLLQGLLAGTPGSRVVVTTSVASHIGKVVLDDLDYARRTYRGFCAYADTKLMNILFVAELRRRLATFGPSIATAVHPGAVASSFGRGSLLPRFLYRVPIRKELLIGYFVHTPEGGAEPLVWHVAGGDGALPADCIYFRRFRCARPPSPQGGDPHLARELWERSEKLVEPWMEPWKRPLASSLSLH